jgi:hypothetical protein
MKNRVALVALTSVLMSLIPFTRANSAIVSDLPFGIDLPMPNLDYTGAGPQTLAPGITWSSTFNRSSYGYDGIYGFNANGLWDNLNMMGLGTSEGTMTIKFDSPVMGVGGFVNYATGWPITRLAVFNNGHLIDSIVLTFLTGGGQNKGRFIYFLESAPIITSFTLTNAYVGLADLEYQIPQTPLPGTLSLFGGGLGLMSFFGWWRRRNSQPLR